MPSLLRPHRMLATALLFGACLQIAGCDSPEQRAQQHLTRAKKLVAEHDSARAAIEFKSAIRLKRDSVDAWRALAEIDEEAKDWPHVAADLRAIVDIAPDDVATRVKLGKILLIAGSTDQALKIAEAGLQRANSADLHALKAAIAIKNGDNDQAAHEAQIALAADPDNADAAIILAIQRMNNGDAEGAWSLLDRDDRPDFKGTNLGLQLLKISLLGRMGNLVALERTLEALTASAPDVPTYRSLLAAFYVGQGQLDSAEQVLREYAEQHASGVAPTLMLTRFLLETRNAPTEAREVLEASIRTNGDLFPLEIALVKVDRSEGRLDDCRGRLEGLLKKNSNLKQIRHVRLALAELALSQKDLDRAEAALTELLQVGPDALALKMRASIRIQRRRYDSAIPDLVEAGSLEPRSTEIMLLLATAYERSGLIELADKQFADAIRISNFDVSIGRQYVAFLQRRGSTGRAEEIIRQLVARRPNDTQLSLMAVHISMAHQDWDGTQKIADSLRENGNSGLADQIVGMMLLERNRPDDAIAAFRRAHLASPKSFEPLKWLVAALIKAGRLDEAENLGSELGGNPKSADLLVLRASVDVARNDFKRALSGLQSAVHLEPKNTAAYQALAELLLKRKEYDQAIQTLRTAISEVPDDSRPHLLLARALEQNGNYEEAMSEYEGFLEKEPGNLIAVNNLAALILERSTDQVKLNEAQLIVAGLRKSPVPEFKDTLCWADYLRGDYRRAASLCEEAAAALPNQASVQYHSAMTLIALGQPSKASERLKRALDLSPDEKLSNEIHAALDKTAS